MFWKRHTSRACVHEVWGVNRYHMQENSVLRGRPFCLESEDERTFKNLRIHTFSLCLSFLNGSMHSPFRD